MPLVGAVIEIHQRGAAFALFGLTLATCVYTLDTVPLLTPRDSAHVIPALAAVLTSLPRSSHIQDILGRRFPRFECLRNTTCEFTTHAPGLGQRCAS
jgi:hypothetical protein